MCLGPSVLNYEGGWMRRSSELKSPIYFLFHISLKRSDETAMMRCSRIQLKRKEAKQVFQSQLMSELPNLSADSRARRLLSF